MKKIGIWSMVVLCVILLWRCGQKDSAVKVVEQGGEKLWVCDVQKVKDTVVVPLSELIESIQVVRLDTAKQALIGEGRVFITDNYIGISSSQQPYKLFDHSGKFLRNVGAVGKGPGEYLNIYCSQIDEAGDRVYLLPWQTRKLLRFDLSGEAKEPLLLAGGMPKGNFRVADGMISGMALPLPGVPFFAFYQDMEGNVLDTVPAGPYVEKENFYSNEIYSSFNGDGDDLYVFRWAPRQDTLYHYDGKAKRLIPRFTANFSEGNMPMHIFGEFPHHYFIETMEMIQTEWGGTTGNPKTILVDKDKETATYCRIEDDLLLKGKNVGTYAFANKMFVLNYPAVSLIEELEKTLKRDDLSSEVRTRAQDLLNGLNEEDNNVIIWGKMK